MESVSGTLISGAALWLLVCVAAIVFLVRKHGRRLVMEPEPRLILIGLGLLTLAPCTYLLIYRVGGSPSFFASGAQITGALLMFAAAWRARRVRLDPDKESSAWVFPQKSALLTVAALGVLCFSYFGKIWQATPEEATGAFVDAIILLIVLMIVGHIVIALFHVPLDDLDAPTDERDRVVALRSMRNAYYVLAAGFWSMPVLFIVQSPLMIALNAWFAMLVLAELVYYGSVFAYYRFGTA